MALHWAHRAGALLVGVLVVALIGRARRLYGRESSAYAAAGTALSLYAAQVVLGATAVLWLLPAVISTQTGSRTGGIT